MDGWIKKLKKEKRRFILNNQKKYKKFKGYFSSLRNAVFDIFHFDELHIFDVTWQKLLWIFSKHIIHKVVSKHMTWWSFEYFWHFFLVKRTIWYEGYVASDTYQNQVFECYEGCESWMLLNVFLILNKP